MWPPSEAVRALNYPTGRGNRRRALSSALVNQHNNCMDPLGMQFWNQGVDRFCLVFKREPRDTLRRHNARRRLQPHTDERDANSLECLDGVRREESLASCRVHHIRRQILERGAGKCMLLQACLKPAGKTSAVLFPQQFGRPPVEFVVADGAEIKYE